MSHSHTSREGMRSSEQVFIKIDRRISDLTSLSDNFSNVDNSVFEFVVSVTGLDVTFAAAFHLLYQRLTRRCETHSGITVCRRYCVVLLLRQPN